jgi:hypothetical protein
MPQPTLFDDQAQERRTGRGQKVVYENDPEEGEDEPQAPEAEPKGEGGDRADSEAVAAAVLSALEDEGERDTMRARYARLLWKAAHRYVTVGSGAQKQALEALTDKEAADLLGCEKTTVNARRNELMGGMPQYEACPVVVEAGSRKSHVRPTKHENTIYAINPRLVKAAQS